MIDDEDADLLALKWHVSDRERTSYAMARKPGSGNNSLYLHREVAARMGVDVSIQVDHRNRHGLDCRRENLRPASVSQNNANRGKQRNNSAGYKGVYFHKMGRKWLAQISVNGTNRYLGLFATPEDAARRYDAVAIEAYGEFALLNFPVRP